MAAEPDDDFAEQVLAAVDSIPPGFVMSYGDVAEYVGAGGPRQVGAVMSRGGGGAVPWWRVVHADGSITRELEEQALARLREDDTPLRGARVDMRRARWDGRPARP